MIKATQGRENVWTFKLKLNCELNIYPIQSHAVMWKFQLFELKDEEKEALSVVRLLQVREREKRRRERERGKNWVNKLN